jgi:hypothetical protein
MKNLNRLAGLVSVLGFIASLVGYATSASAQNNNAVYGEYKKWQCVKGTVEIKLQTTPFIGRRNEDGTMPKPKFEWFTTTQNCPRGRHDEITAIEVQKNFDANGYGAKYNLDAQGRIVDMDLF